MILTFSDNYYINCKYNRRCFNAPNNNCVIMNHIFEEAYNKEHSEEEKENAKS